ncbi:EF-hand domain-containing protein [Saccharothrix luteola]|uniref:EF-hand domain-containing protein n=1 Tax=Saccharothrix luteola TaxID=2893018 RepID=UPI001E3BEA3F|nr:EF-hand domain-containing protein [Saccharothrix luteola]MCC8249762.1 EF-hand domain-containing protein [Saccharothrix luteola]
MVMPTAVNNDRLKKRFQKWDVNANGTVEKSDFRAEAERIIEAFGEDATSPQARALIDAYLAMFDFFASKTGVGADGAMTEEQFVGVFEAAVHAEGDAGFNRVIRPTVAAMVGLCDTDGDGELSPGEFRKWLEAIGVDASSATESFQLIDTSGNGKLTVAEVVNAVRAYLFGTLDVPLLGH